MSTFVNQLSNLSLDLLPAAAPLLQSMGLPVDEHTLMVIAPVAKFLKNIHFVDTIKDYESRNLSAMQKEKLDEVGKVAFSAFYRLAEKNGWSDNNAEGYSNTQNLVESIDDVLNKAINESRKTKRVIIGTYLGNYLYYLNSTKPNWDNIFYISSMIKKLTFRQLCLISLIGNKFKDIDKGKDNLCITNKVVISELNDLKSQNYWIPLFGYMGGPQEYPLPFKYIVPTQFTSELKINVLDIEDLKDEYSKVVDSLDIKPINEADFPDSFLFSMNNEINKQKTKEYDSER